MRVMKVESTAIKHPVNFNCSRPDESKMSLFAQPRQIYELTQYAFVILYYVISFNIKDIGRYRGDELLSFMHISKIFAY